ncbi:MAG TPA: universal stress protein [Bryobacteraceae bacterium]|nr:universal stress protein [Bryobacteraceae bacterium]
MIRFSRILFPVDFSNECKSIAPAVQAMARQFSAEVTLLHVMDLPASWFGPPEAAAWGVLVNIGRLREEGAIALHRFAAACFAGFPVNTLLAEGEVGRAIIESAEKHHIDLIMLPTRGLGPFRAFLLGSVTAKVLHDARCPVWTGVHTEQIAAHPPERWRQLLCAVDTDSRDIAVLKWAADFAAGQNLEPRIVHAVQGADTTLTRDSDPGMYEFLFNVARERISQMQTEAGTRFEVCLLGGNIARAVHQAAIGHNADLIVIGRGVLQRTLGRLRSGAYSIIREAPCPVISI